MPSTRTVDATTVPPTVTTMKLAPPMAYAEALRRTTSDTSTVEFWMREPVGNKAMPVTNGPGDRHVSGANNDVTMQSVTDTSDSASRLNNNGTSNENGAYSTVAASVMLQRLEYAMPWMWTCETLNALDTAVSPTTRTPPPCNAKWRNRRRTTPPTAASNSHRMVGAGAAVMVQRSTTMVALAARTSCTPCRPSTVVFSMVSWRRRALSWRQVDAAHSRLEAVTVTATGCRTGECTTRSKSRPAAARRAAWWMRTSPRAATAQDDTDSDASDNDAPSAREIVALATTVAAWPAPTTSTDTLDAMWASCGAGYSPGPSSSRAGCGSAGRRTVTAYCRVRQADGGEAEVPQAGPSVPSGASCRRVGPAATARTSCSCTTQTNPT